ncbi:hypothetical protein ALO_09034 [Acetonema longum DSM 6540]|uniref:DUF421 domain-containing protein n=1 Tax=Acetonema longum DSM 6540 TaxID=1009370 RepID=F7NIA8_9FIRM|nr:hypothetical protein ALO_09034 [Acetonema longum DSM 6540]
MISNIMEININKDYRNKMTEKARLGNHGIGYTMSVNNGHSRLAGVKQMNEALVVAVRGIIGFFTLLIFARALGKQQISQLTFFDYVLGITIGSTASTLTTDLDSSGWPHWVGLLTWVAAGLATQWVTLKSLKISKFINGEPVVVIMNGKILEDSMRTLRYRAADLLEQLREKGVFDLNQVAFAIVETDGQLSVLKKAEYQSVTPLDLKLTPQSAGLANEIILDGILLEEGLRQAQRDRAWLDQELQRRGIRDVSEVFLASLDPSGNLYLDTYRDHLTTPRSGGNTR